MDGPSLEIDPSKFIVVMGPLFTKVALQRSIADDEISSRNASKLPAVDVTGMVNEGVSILLESGRFQSEAELKECEQRYRSALEVEPLAKLSASMQQCGRYNEWLERCFKLDAAPDRRGSSALSHLTQLQDRGCLLVYTGCDDTLSKLCNLPVLLPQDKETVVQWWTGAQKGIMHVHGVFWKPESLQLNCEVYTNPSHPALPAMEQLGHIFRERFVISVGICEQLRDNPMMAKFASTFLSAARHRHCFNLTMSQDRREMVREYPLLHLPLLESQTGQPLPELAFTPLSEASKRLCAEINFPAIHQHDHQMMALLVSGKTEASEIAKTMFSSPGVSFALMSSISVLGQTAHSVSLRVESARIGDLWAWLWEEKKAVLSRQGLQALILQSGTVIWLEGKARGYVQSSGYGMETEIQPKQEPPSPTVVPMETTPQPHPHPSVVKPNPKLLSPLVRQEFPIPKPGAKQIPRYTITKLPPGAVKPSGGGVPPGTSFTLPAGNGLSKVNFGLHHGFSDDTAMYSQVSDLPKSVLARRSSLPPSILASSSAHHQSSDDSMLYKLAENCQNVSSELHPPSYTAIKQALLCDKYKRRQSMQTDPKTLKNLLQTKLVISDRNEDLVNLRRKSDPGSYLKQRDFERRKELFLDENISWSKSYGKVIDHHIQRWQRKKQQKLQREFMTWQSMSGSTLNPLKLSMLNPLIATPQGMVNPLQVGTNPTLFPSTFLNPTAAAASSGGVVTTPYIIPPSMGGVAPTAAAAASGTPIYYNPFGAQYTLVSPYSSLQLAQPPQSTTYLIPQAGLTTAQPNIYYYVPTATPTTSATPTATPTPHGGAASSNSSQYGSLTSTRSGSSGSLPMSPPSASSLYPQQPTINTPSPPPSGGEATLHTPRPVSPNSRKRHQSVPEKLTSLLQLPPPLLHTTAATPTGAGAGRVSPMEVSNPDSPPVSKKQRSTSDTILYHAPYGLPQLSPGQRSPSNRHSTSPQPPANGATATSFDGLSALQTHLLQVHHQSYGMNRTAQEERQKRRNRSYREGQGHSPRRKHSGGMGKNGSVSPISIQSLQSSEGEEGADIMTSPALHPTPSPVMREEGPNDNDRIKRENSQPENNNDISQLQLWQFLLELLVSSDTSLLQWTDNEFEFQITKPTELSQLWGQFKGTNNMTYDHFLAGIKCHFNQGIMSQVQGRKLTFRFAGHIRNYVQLRRSQAGPVHEEVVVV